MSKIVLCVDDSATMQQVADITFRGTEFQYVGARSFDEAVEKAKLNKPAVVLADSAMPGKSGYDLCLALKTEGKLGDVPIIILVGNAAPYDTALAAKVGADGQLPKPWDTQTMLEKVGEVVAKAASGVAKPGQAAPAAAPAAAPKPIAAQPSGGTAVPAPAAAAAGSGANMPPRSATIMGMPTIKMPAGVAPVATMPETRAPAPAKTTVMAVPPVTAGAGAATPGLRPPAASTSQTSQPAVQAAAPAAASSNGNGSGGHSHAATSVGGFGRSPMVAGNATKRSALVEATLAKMGARLAEATGLAVGSPELIALVKLSTEVVERIVWEVVPDLAEQIIRENLQDLTARKSSS